jgi:hypothetical protein
MYIYYFYSIFSCIHENDLSPIVAAQPCDLSSFMFNTDIFKHNDINVLSYFREVSNSRNNVLMLNNMLTCVSMIEGSTAFIPQVLLTFRD